MPKFDVRHLPAILFALAFTAATVATSAQAQPQVPPRPGAGGTDAEGFIPLPGGDAEAYYFVVGEGPPDLIVYSSPFLDGELLPLTDAYTVAFVHSRGRGASSSVHDPTGISLDTELADVDAVRVFFGLDRIPLAGTSFWGGVVGAYAARHPDRVDRIALLNPIPLRASWMSEPPNAPEHDVEDLRAHIAALREAGADTRDAYAFCREELRLLSADTVVDLDRLAERRSDPCQYRNEHTAVIDPLVSALFGSLGAWDLRPGLESVTAPALVVYGSHDLAVEGAFREWAELLPNARRVRVDEAGHEPLIDRPEVVLDAMRAWLAEPGAAATHSRPHGAMTIVP